MSEDKDEGWRAFVALVVIWFRVPIRWAIWCWDHKLWVCYALFYASALVAIVYTLRHS